MTPPRLFVIVASQAEEAVIFRKGPASWCHIVRWDMRDDSFHRGAWIRGRVYADRCDLSPDGKLLLYFALQGNRWHTSYRGSYSAVSRTPWLKALALWPQGDTWGGGGRFSGNTHVLLRSCGPGMHPDHADRGITFAAANPARHRSSGDVEGADWSGRDHRSRLIFAKQGKVFRRGDDGVDRALIDLCGLVPDPRPAPAWAGEPIRKRRR